MIHIDSSIQLDDRYVLFVDRLSWTLAIPTGKRDKKGNPTFHEKWYYQAPDQALKGWFWRRQKDLLEGENMTLQEFVRATRELHKEIHQLVSVDGLAGTLADLAPTVRWWDGWEEELRQAREAVQKRRRAA